MPDTTTTAVYALREYKVKGTKEINLSDIEKLKQDFPDADYVCIFVRTKTTSNIKEANKLVRDNKKVFGPISNIEYALGSAKGTPPATTSSL